MIEHIPLCRQSNDPSARELDYYVDQLKYLRNLYLTGNSHIDMEAYMTFQAFLDIFGTWYNETFWNTRRIMKMVSEERAEEPFIIVLSTFSWHPLARITSLNAPYPMWTYPASVRMPSRIV